MDKRDILAQKVLDGVELDRMLAFWRFKNQKISMAYGTFEVLKPGTIEMIIQTANKGTAVLAVVKSDEIVKKQKGDGFPKNNQCNRAMTVAAQMLVSGVFVIETEDPTELIEKVKPAAIAYCNNAASLEIKAFEKAKEWNAEVIHVDTDKDIQTKNDDSCCCS